MQEFKKNFETFSGMLEDTLMFSILKEAHFLWVSHKKKPFQIAKVVLSTLRVIYSYHWKFA